MVTKDTFDQTGSGLDSVNWRTSVCLFVFSQNPRWLFSENWRIVNFQKEHRSLWNASCRDTTLMSSGPRSVLDCCTLIQTICDGLIDQSQCWSSKNLHGKNWLLQMITHLRTEWSWSPAERSAFTPWDGNDFFISPNVTSVTRASSPVTLEMSLLPAQWRSTVRLNIWTWLKIRVLVWR